MWLLSSNGWWYGRHNVFVLHPQFKSFFISWSDLISTFAMVDGSVTHYEISILFAADVFRHRCSVCRSCKYFPSRSVVIISNSLLSQRLLYGSTVLQGMWIVPQFWSKSLFQLRQYKEEPQLGMECDKHSSVLSSSSELHEMCFSPALKNVPVIKPLWPYRQFLTRWMPHQRES